jgi:hypothetical protein
MKERKEYRVRMPIPHRKQAKMIASPAKRKVVPAGRRVGKTTGVAIMSARAALKGKRVLEAAPTVSQTDAFWNHIKNFFAEGIKAGVVKKNETTRRIEIPGAGSIRCKTAWNADTLRGDYADFLILDEFQMMEPDTWDLVGAPMLLDNDGDATFIGTPNRRNHFYKMYQRAIADDTGRWGYWHFTSFDNPHLSQEALDEIIQDMSDEAYRQEILAEFLEGEGQVFKGIEEVLYDNVFGASPEHHLGHRIVAGIDWGKMNDYTAISIGCSTCQREIAISRFNKIGYDLQKEKVIALAEKWKPRVILAESNSIGQPIIDELQRTGLPVEGFQTTASSKPPLIESLVLAIENQEWMLIDDDIWTGELEAYERTVTNLGRSQYNAPKGLHDDTVIARALMVWQSQQVGNVRIAQSRVKGRKQIPMIRRSVRKVSENGYNKPVAAV